MKSFLKHIWKLITKPGRGKRVFVGVSGGVDSSVAALLLKVYGYDVTGVFIRTWQPDWTPCTWQDERRDAMRVCAHLEIPFIELNLEQEYKQGVADYMITEYRKGRTPNPDVMCNKEVKFGGFLNYAIDSGADFVATGHYAQTDQKNLIKGIDEKKDQSYFLWTLNNEQLQRILFPVGGFEKSFVRFLARLYRIPVATKKDSQGICFLGDIDMKEFLSHYIETSVGVVKNEQDDIIGTHDGVLLYTIGERHGFTIHKKTPNDEPYYVVGKNIPTNELIVSQKIKNSDEVMNVLITDIVERTPFQESKKYHAQIRYHGIFHVCTLEKQEDGIYKVIFEKGEQVSAGQSIVFYDGTICIGGGVVQ